MMYRRLVCIVQKIFEVIDYEVPNVVVEDIVSFTQGKFLKQCEVKIVDVSTLYSASYSVEHFNNDTGYFCSQSGGPHWILLQLSHKIQIKKIEMLSIEGTPKSLQIQKVPESERKPESDELKDKQVTYEIGDVVSSLYQNGNYYQCTLQTKNADGTFNVRWHDGDTQDRLSHP
eukprot:UN25751